ncbi:hypothetical protein [Polyangium sp. y55x31]|uniref:hypothetical protein n=1 Tax=Polyangium sp. y55x31 TaxID=3042688 RepID=UPI00248244A0|nr:hypothetical protein [Polyangium sp. y55x31]MDI1478731.1 hypothetical protein [Polyangium sp. y55x31]
MTHSMVFFTKIDDRAKVKGSRDPLGIEPIWSAFGREVVGNLTTVTTSLRGFTTLVLGMYFVDRLVERGRVSEGARLSLFLRAEQLAAYSRHAAGQEGLRGELRGIERVKDRLASGGSVKISADPAHQILSDQRTYGLWGLYSQAARKSGIFDTYAQKLTPDATDFVELFHAGKLRGFRKEIEDLIGKKEAATFDPYNKHRACAATLARQLAPKVEQEERDYYMKTLVEGGEGMPPVVRARQSELWETMAEVYDSKRVPWNSWFGMKDLRELEHRAEKAGRGALAERLSYIRDVEPLLGAVARLFGYLMRCGGRSVKAVAKDVEDTWGKGLVHLEPEALPRGAIMIFDHAASDKARGRIVDAGSAMQAGKYSDAIRLVLEQNEAVMNARGGAAPWVKIDRGKLDVRFRGDDWPSLPSRSEMPDLWTNSYFLNSLKAIGRSVVGRA